MPFLTQEAEEARKSMLSFRGFSLKDAQFVSSLVEAEFALMSDSSHLVARPVVSQHPLGVLSLFSTRVLNCGVRATRLEQQIQLVTNYGRLSLM